MRIELTPFGLSSFIDEGAYNYRRFHGQVLFSLSLITCKMNAQCTGCEFKSHFMWFTLITEVSLKKIKINKLKKINKINIKD